MGFSPDRLCGTESPPIEDQLIMMQEIAAFKRHRQQHRQLQLTSFDIPVKFIHIKEDASDPSLLDESSLMGAIDNWNNDFTTPCLNFVYEDFIEHVNPDWAVCEIGNSTEQEAMGEEFGVGMNMTVLHIFICDTSPSAGYAYLPWTIPGNNLQQRNRNAVYAIPSAIVSDPSRVVAHEIGHW